MSKVILFVILGFQDDRLDVLFFSHSYFCVHTSDTMKSSEFKLPIRCGWNKRQDVVADPLVNVVFREHSNPQCLSQCFHLLTSAVLLQY